MESAPNPATGERADPPPGPEVPAEVLRRYLRRVARMEIRRDLTGLPFEYIPDDPEDDE